MNKKKILNAVKQNLTHEQYLKILYRTLKGELKHKKDNK